MSRHQDETGLALAAAAGDDVAFARLCRMMRGWLHQRADRFYAPGLEHDDLLQEARIGLFKACRDWDASRPVPFPAFAALCVDRQLVTAIKTAQRGKHGPLNDSLRLDRPIDDQHGAATLAEVIPASASTDPAVIVAARCELRIVVDTARDLTVLERSVLARRLGGATLEAAGAGLGRHPVKTADNALQRGRRKIAEALEAA